MQVWKLEGWMLEVGSFKFWNYLGRNLIMSVGLFKNYRLK